MIILDTSFFVAFKNERDEHHDAAARHWPDVVADGPVLVHEYAFAEITAVLVRRVGLERAVEHARMLLDATEVEFVPGWPNFQGAWTRFETQRGARHGLADAAMLQLAEDRGVRRIATFDREFGRAHGLQTVPGQR